MKNRYYFHSLICLLAVSCTVQEFDTPTFPLAPDSSGDDVFYASLESYSAPDTRVSVDENIKFYWDAADQISIFNRNSQNQSYQFSGETGDKSGTFTRVSDPVEAENNLGSVYAVYPYQETTSIYEAGVISLTFPSVQTYKAGSFGPGANLMVSMTDDNFLSFKNLGGYLVLKFTGSGSIKSIKLEGNGNEPLSGKATVTTGVEPAISMASTAGTSITLNCETPVELGSTPTIFWMVVPPTTFTQGFTLTVTDPNGYVFFKETTRTDLAITRNSVLRIAPIAVSFNTSGISFSKNDITLVVPQNKSFPYSVDEEDRTFTVTVPTLTDFSNLNFDFGSKTVYADGIKITNGETPIDASKDVTLTVRYPEKTETPALAVTLMLLPQQGVTDVVTENAAVLNEAGRLLLVGWAVPGADDALKLPASFSASFHADHADLSWMMTLVTSSPIEAACREIDEHMNFDARQMLANAEKLLVALESGEPLPETEGKLNDVAARVNELNNGLTELDDGAVALRDGAAQLSGGAAQLKDGTAQLSDGAAQLKDGAAQVADGAAQVRDGMAQLSDGTSVLKDGAAQVSGGASQVRDGIAQLSDGAVSAKDGAAQLSEGAAQLKDGAAQVSGGAVSVRDGAAQLKDGAQTLSGALGQLADGAAQLHDGSAQLNDGAAALAAGMAEANGGAAQLTAGLNTLKTNNDALNQGAQAIFAAILDTANGQLAASGLDAAGIELPALTAENYAAVLEGALEKLNPEALQAAAAEQVKAAVTAQVEANADQVREAVNQAVEASHIEGCECEPDR